LPADAEKQLHRRIVHLQEAGSGLTLNRIYRFAVQVCKEHSIQNPWKGRMMGKGLTLRKAENFSYGRLMIFSRETRHEFFTLLRQTMNAMKLHQRPNLIYKVDERGFKLTYSSGNQKLLAVNDSKEKL
jgi:hypothetical protein